MLQVGAKLGPYEILAPLGVGGMGRVYKARDTRLGRQVAIKVLEGGSGKPSSLRRFELEARAASSLNHPNVLAVHDVGTHEGEPYIVSELLDGHTLRELLRDRPLPMRVAIDLARQMANGLSAAHERGFVHRDLKPENVFVTADGHLKILDFGLAKALQSEDEVNGETASEEERWLTAPSVNTASGVTVGTPGYTSPEQVRGQPIDARSDIFSFGLVLHEMLSGQRAFHRATRAETGWAILHDDPPDLAAGIPSELDRIVRRCLAKEPRDRFQSARDLAFALEAPLSGSTLKVPRLRVRPRVVGRVALGLAAALALAAVFALGGRWGGPLAPEYRRLTFRPGRVNTAHFAADRSLVVYSAAWQGDVDTVYASRLDSAAAFPIYQQRDAILFSVSAHDELLMGMHPHRGPLGFVFTLARSPLTGGAPREIAEEVMDADWSPDGSHMALARVVEGQARLEYPEGTVLQRASAPFWQTRVSPRGDRVAVVESAGDDDYISVVDLRGEKTRLVKGGREGLAWGPLADEIWYTEAGSLYGISMRGRRRLLARNMGGAYLLDVSRAGEALLARYDARRELMIASLTDGRESDYSWLTKSELLDLSRDGSAILFADAGSVFLRNTRAQFPVKLGEGRAWRGLSPDGSRVAVVENGVLQLLPTGPGSAEDISMPGLQPQSAQFFPDGHSLLVVATDAAEAPRLFVVDAARKVRPISEPGVSPRHHAIAPDGRRVAALFGAGRVALLPVDGGPSRVLANMPANGVPIGFLDDGVTLVASVRGAIPAPLYKLDTRTGEAAIWRTIGPGNTWGVMSFYTVVVTPDAKWVAFDYHRERSDLYIATGLR